MSKEIKNLKVNIKIEFDEEKAAEKIKRISELLKEVQHEIDTFPQLVKIIVG